MKKNTLIYSLALSFLALSAFSQAQAGDVTVTMLNRGKEGPNVFEPNYVEIQPGDTVHFVATQRGHNAASIKEMSPEGFKGFLGKIDHNISVKFDIPGYYGVKCTPHYTMGKVMIIKVGDGVEMSEQFRNFGVNAPGMAGKRFKQYIERIDKANSSS